MRARLVDWSLFAFVLLELLSGFYSFTIGKPQGRWFFWLHGIMGLALVLLLVWKVQRVWSRLANRRLWSEAMLISLFALTLALLAIGSGVLWSGWQTPLGYPNGLNWHVILGVLLAILLGAHIILRYKPLQLRDFEGRRSVSRYLLVLASGAALWAGQQGVNQALDLPGARRRFTGSRETGSMQGLAYPVTMWMFDNPPPLDLAAWRLRVHGAVQTEFVLEIDDILQWQPTTLRATLDCTGGWYSEQEWHGIPVTELLARAQPHADATHVSFVSSTGYRWSVPVAEAHGLVLATHAGNDALDHGRGAPLRLVAPGRRGFQWVKWVSTVHIRTGPDPAQWGAIFGSGLDGR